MQIVFLCIGPPKTTFINEGMEIYQKRISRYAQLKFIPLKYSKFKEKKKVMEDEARRLMSEITPRDRVVLLDEKGMALSSLKFADFLESELQQASGRLVFVVGGPYGFHQEVYERANKKLSLSPMTFPHELVRIVFLEQLYRAFTIKHNTPYHHE